MAQKIYLITIKESEKLASFYEAYDSFEKAVSHIKNGSELFNRHLEETELKNEFKVVTNSGDFLHTLRIIDVWLR
jgi:hypothetical protein